jgi:acyl carrier protein
MNDDQARAAVAAALAHIAPEADLADVDPDGDLREQLDLDSMDFLDIVMELRKRYGVEVPEEDYPKLATLNSCVEYLTPLMADK